MQRCRNCGKPFKAQVDRVLICDDCRNLGDPRRGVVPSQPDPRVENKVDHRVKQPL